MWRVILGYLSYGILWQKCRWKVSVGVVQESEEKNGKQTE